MSEYHQFSPNEVTNLYNRIIAAENQLAKLEREHKSQIEYLESVNEKQSFELGSIKSVINDHDEWLQKCDKAIKDLRSQINISTKPPEVKPIKDYKLNWKFWK